MILKFELSMPNVGSWNGKWTGEDRFYARTYNYTQRFGTSKKAKDRLESILTTGNYWYNFGDGWSANVSVEKIDGRQAKGINKKSKGFMGYDWMIDSILWENEILDSSQRKEKRMNIGG